MGIREVDTDQRDSYCNCCSGRDAILVYFGSGDFSVPRQQTSAVSYKSESLYTMNPLFIGKDNFIDINFTDVRIVYSKSYVHIKWEPVK